MLNNEYYLWGAGTYGGRLIEFMKNDLTFKAVIDSDPAKQGTVFHGVPVISYDKAKASLPKIKIVMSPIQPYPMRSFLLREGFVENMDFYSIYDFLPRYYWEKNKLVALYTNMPATTMCNMKCNVCQTYIPMGANHKNISAANIKNDADLMFAHIDSFLNVCFCCGESLLNGELSDVCLYIYEKYAGRYYIMTIPTNGTIIPKDDAMRRFSDSQVLFSISDYPENTQTREKFIEKCNEFNVNWFINSTGDKENWYDFGDPRIVSETSHEKLQERYKKCWVAGAGVLDGWLYLCAAQMWAYAVVGVGAREIGDVFDLRQPKTDAAREEVYRLISRQPAKGYISHCMRCEGTTPVSERT